MKICSRLFLIVVMVLSAGVTLAQDRKELAPGYYVVVGAYAASRENVAQNYTDVLIRQRYQADYGYNAVRKLYFVYISSFDNLRTALQEMQRVRRQGKFPDAWVRVVPGHIVQPSHPASADASRPSTDKTVAPEEAPVATNSGSTSAPVGNPQNTTTSSQPDTSNIEVTDNPPIVQHAKMTLGNTEVFISMFNARNNRIIEGDVQVVDTDRAKLIKKVKGNEYLVLPDPKSNTGRLTLICEAFGYRKVQDEITYPLPLADTVKPNIDLMGTTLVINFDMVRYHKGDITTLYNVYFYNDAAIMLPESRYELNSLLEMMQESPTNRIRLHGHTNGNYHGRVITMGNTKNFFTLEGSKESSGSAKDLSRNRAEVIKSFLVENGIAADRVEVKAWGGKRPLYDKRGPNARRNVRVEVEILEE